MIPNTSIITDGITTANIKSSKYLFISIDVGDIFVGDLVKFWILNPKLNEDVPIYKKTIVNIIIADKK
jgi:hypothetical protein